MNDLYTLCQKGFYRYSMIRTGEGDIEGVSAILQDSYTIASESSNNGAASSWSISGACYTRLVFQRGTE